MKKNNKFTVFFAVMAMGAVNLFNPGGEEPKEPVKTITEDYLITETGDEEIMGDIIKGIYIDESHKEFADLKSVTPGNIIQVSYTEEDYLEGNLENVEIEVIKEFITEEFILTDVSSEEIRGEIIKSPTGMGEGIYLDENYKEWDTLTDAVVGDKIEVTYNKEDYFNDTWDNIVKIKIIK